MFALSCLQGPSLVALATQQQQQLQRQGTSASLGMQQGWAGRAAGAALGWHSPENKPSSGCSERTEEIQSPG